MQRAREIGAKEGLKHIYVGNVPGECNTTCARCGRVLVRRVGYAVGGCETDADGNCPECGTPLAGVGMAE
jgi:pyruvate formate lyase activating enzyme